MVTQAHRRVTLPPVEFAEGVIPAALNAGKELMRISTMTVIVLIRLPAWPFARASPSSKACGGAALLDRRAMVTTRPR